MSDGGELAEVLRRVFEQRSEAKPTRILGLLGSSRKDGNTGALAAAVFAHLDDARLIDLGGLSIAPYDYGYRHEADDFLPLARLMTQADAVVFASPVYWYSMSAQMKILFDRLTDLTRKHKTLGRRLAGKSAFVIATGGGAVPPGFETPFSETARYFDMRWGGMLYASFDQDRRMSPEHHKSAATFAGRINKGIKTKFTIAA
jgi:multimeric flavodoxin WrbA